MPQVAIAGAALAVAAVGTYSSIKSQKQQRKAMRRANAAQRAQDNLKAARERREAIRNARLSGAAILQGSVNEGVQGSSAALGGLGSIQQQLNQGLSFLDATNRLSDQASIALGQANEHGSRAQTASAISGLAMQVFSNSGAISKVFSPPKTG